MFFSSFVKCRLTWRCAKVNVLMSVWASERFKASESLLECLRKPLRPCDLRVQAITLAHKCQEPPHKYPQTHTILQEISCFAPLEFEILKPHSFPQVITSSQSLIEFLYLGAVENSILICGKLVSLMSTLRVKHLRAWHKPLKVL